MKYVKIIKHEGGEYVVCADGQLRAVCIFYGSSDEEKPTEGVKGGDQLLEVDTHNIFMYFEDSPNGWELISKGNNS